MLIERLPLSYELEEKDLVDEKKIRAKMIKYLSFNFSSLVKNPTISCVEVEIIVVHTFKQKIEVI